MSYEKEIFNNYIKILKLAKVAVPTAGQQYNDQSSSSTNPNFIKSMVKKLVSKLVREVSGESNVSSEKGTKLTPDNLRDLNSFLTFLRDNKIKINNQLIVNDVKSSDDYIPYPQATVASFYINKKSLSEYMNHLKNKYSERRDISAMIDLLVDDVNKIDPSIGISKERTEFTDEDVVDWFVSNIIRFDIPLASIESVRGIPLKVKDIKDLTTLNSWLSYNKFTFVQDQYEPALSYNDRNLDRCKLVYVLHARAENRFVQSASGSEKEKFTYYINQTKKIGGEIPKCNISQYTGGAGAAGATGAAGTGATGVGAGGAAKEDIKRILNGVCEPNNGLLPLINDAIDIGRINTFIKELEKIQISQDEINNIKRISSEIKVISNANHFPIDYNGSLATLKPDRNDKNRDHNYLIRELRAIVALVYNIISYILSTYNSILTGSAKSGLREQIAIYRRNVSGLDSITNMITQQRSSPRY